MTRRIAQKRGPRPRLGGGRAGGTRAPFGWVARARRASLAAMLAVLAAPALAGVEEAVDHALPRVEAFAEATASLDAAARADCAPEALRPAYGGAFDAWMGVSHLRLGPLEDEGRAQAVAFWPDERDATGRALGALLAAEDPAAEDPAAFAEVSVAARGLLALERLLFETDYEDGSYGCALVRAVSKRPGRHRRGDRGRLARRTSPRRCGPRGRPGTRSSPPRRTRAARC